MDLEQCMPREPLRGPGYLMPKTPQQALDGLDQLSKGSFLAVNIEVDSVSSSRPFLRMLSLATEDHTVAILFDLKTMTQEVHDRLLDLLHGNQVKVAYDWATVSAFLLSANLSVGGRQFDALLAAQLLKAGAQQNHPSFVTLATSLLGEEAGIDSVLDWNRPLKETQLRQVARRTAVLLPLRGELVKLLRWHDLMDVAKVEFDCLPAVVEMEQNGVRVDVTLLHCVAQRLEQELVDCRAWLRQWLPKNVNMDRPAQVRWACSKLGNDIDGLVDSHLQYQDLVNRKTRVRQILEAVHPQTGRIYSRWQQLDAPTGKLFCNDQAIQDARKLAERSAFIPEEGCSFVIGGINQIGLRVAAQLSEDEEMIKALLNDQDFHCFCASKKVGVFPEMVSPEQRQKTEAINSGLLLGLEAEELKDYGFRRYGVGITTQEARISQRKFNRSYPKMANWIETQKTNQSREIQTLSGRRRRWHPDEVVSQKELVCSQINGTVADIIKMALGPLSGVLLPYSAKILACFDDEIIVEVETEYVHDVQEVLRETLALAGTSYLHDVTTIVEVRTITSCEDH